MRRTSIHDRAQGRWRHLLPALGVPETYLSGRHGPCPICKEGTDRFRWDDKAGRGTWICNRCGSGSGVDLVMRINGVSFLEARKMIEERLPDAPIDLRTTERQTGHMDRFVEMWRSGRHLDGKDPASWYLARRGIQLREYPSALRFLPKLAYWHDDNSKTEHPAMAAVYSSPDRSAATVHFTYLDGSGRKADVPKPKKMAPGKMPPGGAVRLAPSAETMGIAEGIETALSASQIDGIPVWAALSAGGLIKWQPPSTAKHIVVYGDHDESFTGQHAAYSLAYRLRTDGFHVEVRLPDLPGDWNDILISEAS